MTIDKNILYVLAGILALVLGWKFYLEPEIEANILDKISQRQELYTPYKPKPHWRDNDLDNMSQDEDGANDAVDPNIKKKVIPSPRFQQAPFQNGQNCPNCRPNSPY